MDEISQKYKILKDRLVIMKHKLEILEEEYNDLNRIIKETLLIDDKVIEEDRFNSIINDNQKILNELTNVVIPMVNSKV